MIENPFLFTSIFSELKNDKLRKKSTRNERLKFNIIKFIYLILLSLKLILYFFK